MKLGVFLLKEIQTSSNGCFGWLCSGRSPDTITERVTASVAHIASMRTARARTICPKPPIPEKSEPIEITSAAPFRAENLGRQAPPSEAAIVFLPLV
jgi:hypothetical protein